jgi:hypothetical protein
MQALARAPSSSPVPTFALQLRQPGPACTRTQAIAAHEQSRAGPPARVTRGGAARQRDCRAGLRARDGARAGPWLATGGRPCDGGTEADLDRARRTTQRSDGYQDRRHARRRGARGQGPRAGQSGFVSGSLARRWDKTRSSLALRSRSAQVVANATRTDGESTASGVAERAVSPGTQARAKAGNSSRGETCPSLPTRWRWSWRRRRRAEVSSRCTTRADRMYPTASPQVSPSASLGPSPGPAQQFLAASPSGGVAEVCPRARFRALRTGLQNGLAAACSCSQQAGAL